MKTMLKLVVAENKPCYNDIDFYIKWNMQKERMP